MVHTVAPVELDKQTRKKAISARWNPGSASAPMRQGLRSTSAGAKGKAELLARMDMIVAAGGGERDEAVDSAILSGMPKARTRRPFSTST